MTDVSIEATFYAVLGQNIEMQRKHKRLTQSEVGAMIGVHRNTIMRWESGESPVDIWQIMRLADVFQCSHLHLLPPRRFTWGTDLKFLASERDLHCTDRTPVQRERAPFSREVRHAS